MGKVKYNIVSKRLFDCWWNMKSRCNKTNRRDSKYYHDKGITYCDEWNSYEKFQQWALENGYSDELTLDRVDGTKGYSPSNCRWITLAEQQRNKSNCLLFTHDGVTKTLSEWSRDFGINRGTLSDRIFKLGYSFDEAIKKEYGKQKSNVFIKYNGKQYTQAEFARVANCTDQWISKLVKRGLNAEQILDKTKHLRKVEVE